jgi:hypothetical protein
MISKIHSDVIVPDDLHALSGKESALVLLVLSLVIIVLLGDFDSRDWVDGEDSRLLR